MFSNIIDNIPYYLLRIPALLLALTVHETAHGFIAYKLGDPTAKLQGRLTLNPLKHLDPIGTLMMILVGFGWAKPVQINPRNFKHPKTGMAISALAGPLSNMLLAFIGVFLVKILENSDAFVTSLLNGSVFSFVVYLAVNIFITLNLSFAVFNLIPVPPLDGSRILLTFLPQKAYFGIMRYEKYIMLALILLLYIDIPTGNGAYFNVITTPLSYVINAIDSGMRGIWGILPFFKR